MAPSSRHEASLRNQAESLHRLTKEFLRKYQLRDRNEITCCGVSVSQCYALDLLGENGTMTMAALAQQMFLDKSTVTRVVDQLVKRELVARSYSEHDRREVRVALTAAGEALQQEILECQLQSQSRILELIPAEKRDKVLEGLSLISEAIHLWLADCCLVEQPVKITLNQKGQSHVNKD